MQSFTIDAREIYDVHKPTYFLVRPDNYLARDIVWRELVTLACTGAPHWIIAAVGMAMPALIRIAGQLTAWHRGDADAVVGSLSGDFGSLDAERTTGYVLGGISPLGQRKALPTVVDESALDFTTVMVSAGRRGLQVELAPADLVRLTRARTAAIGR